MAKQIRDEFNDVAITLQGRVKMLPAQDQQEIKEIDERHKTQQKQLAGEQARKRQGEIEKEKQRLLQEHPTHDLRPPGIQESYQQMAARKERQAEKNVGQKNDQEMKQLKEQNAKEMEQRIADAERREIEKERERKRAEDLEKAAQRARELQNRNDRDRDRGR